jgi:hypothetical protein
MHARPCRGLTAPRPHRDLAVVELRDDTEFDRVSLGPRHPTHRPSELGAMTIALDQLFDRDCGFVIDRGTSIPSRCTARSSTRS